MTLTASNFVVDETATITITGSSRTNQVVTVIIESPDGGPSSVDISLDGDGNGSKDWTVPDWSSVTLKDAGHCDDLEVMIAQQGGAGA